MTHCIEKKMRKKNKKPTNSETRESGTTLRGGEREDRKEGTDQEKEEEIT